MGILCAPDIRKRMKQEKEIEWNVIERWRKEKKKLRKSNVYIQESQIEPNRRERERVEEKKSLERSVGFAFFLFFPSPGLQVRVSLEATAEESHGAPRLAPF